MTNIPILPKPVRFLANDESCGRVKAYLSQAENHQIIFMGFSEDVDLPEHSHESQWGIVLEGKIELVIDGIKSTYVKGDR